MSLANKISFEGNLQGYKLLTFRLPIRQLTLINDSALNSIKFRFSPSEDYSTLKAGEVLQVQDLRLRELHMTAANADYRVWGLG